MKTIKCLPKKDFAREMSNRNEKLKYLDEFLSELRNEDVVQCIIRQRLLLSAYFFYPTTQLFGIEPSNIKIEKYSKAQYGDLAEPEYTIVTRVKTMIPKIGAHSYVVGSRIYDDLTKERLVSYGKNKTFSSRWKGGNKRDIETIVRKTDN